MAVPLLPAARSLDGFSRCRVRHWPSGKIFVAFERPVEPDYRSPAHWLHAGLRRCSGAGVSPGNGGRGTRVSQYDLCYGRRKCQAWRVMGSGRPCHWQIYWDSGGIRGDTGRRLRRWLCHKHQVEGAREPDVGDPPVRFDERDWKRSLRQPRPVLDSTLVLPVAGYE